jgi:hypothetical protein
MLENFSKYHLENDYQLDKAGGGLNHITFRDTRLPSGGGNSILTSSTAMNNN